MELREGLEKVAGLFENAAKRLLKTKRHSLLLGSLGGGAVGTLGGGAAGALGMRSALRNSRPLNAAEAAMRVLTDPLLIGGAGVGGGVGGGILGASAGAVAQHLRNKARVKALASKLRIGAGVTTGAGAGAAGLAAYKKRKD